MSSLEIITKIFYSAHFKRRLKKFDKKYSIIGVLNILQFCKLTDELTSVFQITSAKKAHLRLSLSTIVTWVPPKTANTNPGKPAPLPKSKTVQSGLGSKGHSCAEWYLRRGRPRGGQAAEGHERSGQVG